MKKTVSILWITSVCIKKYTVSATIVQPHSLDCLFVLSIGGEQLLLQWNKTRFFPLGTGAILKSIQPLIKAPEQNRFLLDPG
ncbi:MAG: hypothetical protein EZS28_047584 [Streblomastix strix]|uniref:Uncharacterized protein n=1 Tax=Streblomastix strix TaxID=222440 RepID=A0A5J4TFI4_9EUKA|nr:MAG: hypothetical protein EZS28_047584 [Streblomastix strix]